MSPREGPGPAARAARAGLTLFALAALVLGAGTCLDRRVGVPSPRTSNAISEELAIDRITKIDLLFMVDNSSSMADKQAILSLAVPDLLRRLTTPNCLQADGSTAPANPVTRSCDRGVPEFEPVKDIHIGVISSSLGGHGGNVCTPEKGRAAVDGGRLLTRRRGPGGEPLPDPVPTHEGLGFLNWNQNDKGEGERDPRALEADFAELVRGVGQDGCGFEASLEAWYRFLVDPSPPKLEPPPLDPRDPSGQTRLSAPPVLSEVDAALLEERANFLRPDSLVAIIALSDENDCSFIEGFYPPRVRGEGGFIEGEGRWPEPYLRHLQVGVGPDEQQTPRQGFFYDAYQLTDRGFVVDNQPGFRLQSGTAACSDPAKGPYSPECFNCGYLSDPAARAAAGCPDMNAPGPAVPAPAVAGDKLNLRCFEQRRRFGFEALHPVQRYIDGLTQRKVYDTSGALIALNKAAPGPDDVKYFADDDPGNRVKENLVAPKVENPLFVDLPWRRYLATCSDPSDPGTCDASKKPEGRDRELPARQGGRIYFAGIVGVPWQDIARDPKTLEPSGDGPGGFKAPSDIDWGLILGDPLAGTPPRDPLMRESIGDRIAPLADKKHPLTGDDLGASWNPINGHEWVPTFGDDLQYACIFPLGVGGAADIQCDDPASGAEGPEGCDCDQSPRPETLPLTRRNPLCEGYDGADPGRPGDGNFTTRQARAKAYPGLRFLEVLRGVGESAIVASICPETQEQARPHFGYRPAVNAVVDRLKTALKGRCLPRRLDVQGTRTPCLIIEARYRKESEGGQPAGAAEVDACRACGAPGYAALRPELLEVLDGQEVTKYDCLCEFRQLEGDDLQRCQTDSRDAAFITDLNGWCYVDPAFAAEPGVRDAQDEIVKGCPADARRTLRFLGPRGVAGESDEQASLFITCLGAASNAGPPGSDAPAAAGRPN